MFYLLKNIYMLWKKVLIVEDDLDIAKLYCNKFEKEWFDVHTVPGWYEALIYLKTSVPDIILLDLMMPGIDWYDTLKILKSQPWFLSKIFIFSNLDNPSDINKALELWADWYFLKTSITPKQAVEKVKEVVWISC